jgi:hypothetical protein
VSLPVDSPRPFPRARARGLALLCAYLRRRCDDDLRSAIPNACLNKTNHEQDGKLKDLGGFLGEFFNHSTSILIAATGFAPD